MHIKASPHSMWRAHRDTNYAKSKSPATANAKIGE
jgi:hypothetical protein